MAAGSNGWDAWIGRTEQRADCTDPGHFIRWCATLDRQPPPDGTAPQGFHWCLCLPDAPTATLGPDGHPRRDDSAASFLPPIPLPRRMWASSAVEFLQPLIVGEPVTRISRVQSVTEKAGGSGQLVFVDVAHETSGPRGLAVREVQSLVYPIHRALTPSTPLLFRYSALTFNSHRIHYDAPYAIEAENYRGLVVHGPLTATLLLDLARRELGDNTLKSFAFRGLSPAICGEMLHLVLRSTGATFELGAFAADGRQVMRATAE